MEDIYAITCKLIAPVVSLIDKMKIVLAVIVLQQGSIKFQIARMPHITLVRGPILLNFGGRNKVRRKSRLGRRH